MDERVGGAITGERRRGCMLSRAGGAPVGGSTEELQGERSIWVTVKTSRIGEAGQNYQRARSLPLSFPGRHLVEEADATGASLAPRLALFSPGLSSLTGRQSLCRTGRRFCSVTMVFFSPNSILAAFKKNERTSSHHLSHTHML